MAGLHFCCGKWLGEDKSANRFFDIVDKELQAFVPSEESDTWTSDFFAPYFVACLSSQEEESLELRLTPKMMRALLGPLSRYRDALVQRLGLPEPDPLEEWRALPESEEKQKLRCVQDLLRGNEVCQRSRRAIKVYLASESQPRLTLRCQREPGTQGRL